MCVSYVLASALSDIVYYAVTSQMLIWGRRVSDYAIGPAHVPYRLASVIALSVSINALIHLFIWKVGWIGSRFPENCCQACGYEMGSLPHCPECGPDVKQTLLQRPPLRLALIVPIGGMIIAFPLLVSPLWLSWIA